MPVSPARQAAFDILLRVERDGAWASELLNAPRVDRLSREDRALCHELVMTTLRWQSALDARIARYSSQQISRLDAEVRTALRLAACQLFYLDRIPAHAAVHESVELVKASGKRSAAPFANAVLRKLAAEGKSAAFPPQRTEDEPAATPRIHELASGFAHPEWIVARWIDMYGFKAARAICEADQQPPVTALRMEPGHDGNFAEMEQELSATGIRLGPGKLLASARRLISGNLAQCAAFREHRVAAQDEASQLVAALVGHGTRILDCCAAPGGKTAAIAARNPGAEIVAVELHEHRARALRERLRGLPVKVVEGDAAVMEWTEKFDCVLADVPCSGTGTLAANPEIKWRLRPEDLTRLHPSKPKAGLPGTPLKDLQISILRTAAAALAPGGRLVYSTCSLEAEECEQVVEKVLSASGALAVVDCNEVLQELKDRGELVWSEPASLVRGPYLRTLPGIHPCDGFFAAVLRNEKATTLP